MSKHLRRFVLVFMEAAIGVIWFLLADSMIASYLVQPSVYQDDWWNWFAARPWCAVVGVAMNIAAFAVMITWTWDE